ncbi:peptidase domain-containing ABC transporter [Luteimonas sp. C4P040a]|nr:peptidase domain-containing ABC transporter [Luteimonas fraxinea]
MSGVLGIPLCPHAIKSTYGVGTRGLAASHVIGILRDHGFVAGAVAVDPRRPQLIQSPCIVILDDNHFVLVESTTQKEICIFDPAFGAYRLSHADFSSRFGGCCIEASRTSRDPDVASLRSRVSIAAWLRQFSWSRPLALVFATALLAQGISICMPLVSREIVDSATAASPIFAPANIALYAATAIASILTAQITAYIGARVSAKLSAELMRSSLEKLIGFPLSYFKRQMPAVLSSRLRSVDTIQALLIRFLSSGLVEGLIGIASLVVLAVIAPSLALAILIARAISIAGDLWFAPKLAGVAESSFREDAKFNALLIETLAAIGTIKNLSANKSALNKLSDSLASSIGRDLSYQILNQKRDLFLRGTSTAEQVVVLAVGALLVSGGSISIGTLLAALMYREFARAGFAQLQNIYADYYQAQSAIARVEDILNSSVVQSTSQHQDQRRAVAPSGDSRGVELTFESLSFRYGRFEPLVLDDLDLHIAAGESVAITGPSGCGKSTLAQLAMGALKPTHGRVLVAGVELTDQSHEDVLWQIGCVMQDDHLLTGTIRDNIAFFRDVPDEDVIAAARHAQIHDFITSLPMRYETLVSDAFPSLSGGQRQRVLIARALANNPQLLIMDEATSALDEASELAIGRSVASLSMTRLIIAHRKETIALCDRVIRMETRTHAEI